MDDLSIKLIEAYNTASSEVFVINDVGQREIPEHTWDNYLDKIDDPIFKDIVSNVRKYTKYVPWYIFKINLHLSFNKFLKNIGKTDFKIFVDMWKFGSQNLLIILLWNKIRHLDNFKGFVTAKTIFHNPCSILIVDDCSYSGHTTIGAIDEITSNNRNVKFDFHIVIPYICMKTLLDELEYHVINVKFDLYNVVDTYCIPRFDKLNDTLNEYGLEGDHLVPIYFDHKVGGGCSTFYKIYMRGYIPGKEDFGMLLPIVPHTDIKNEFYQKYFKDIFQPPQENSHI
tara:strand:+ start:1832 stop:2683 length:852 start_codon:yes stop_codon:yes gene_type:complete